MCEKNCKQCVFFHTVDDLIYCGISGYRLEADELGTDCSVYVSDGQLVSSLCEVCQNKKDSCGESSINWNCPKFIENENGSYLLAIQDPDTREIEAIPFDDFRRLLEIDSMNEAYTQIIQLNK